MANGALTTPQGKRLSGDGQTKAERVEYINASVTDMVVTPKTGDPAAISMREPDVSLPKTDPPHRRHHLAFLVAATARK